MLARVEAAVAANRGHRVAPVAAGIARPARTSAGAAVQAAVAGRRPLAGPFALALVAGGSLLALLGAPVVGVGASAVGLAMFLRSAPTLRRAWAAGLVAGIALSVLGGRALEARADRREAEAQLAALALELERVSVIQGGYPTALDALGWRLVPIFGGARAVDPWGRAWRYRPPDAAGASFALGSLGPDGAPDTGDEIGRPPPAE
jgi:hypothetical protein